MIKTKISAVTGVTYGLLSALVIVVALSALTMAGVGVKNVFSLTGNTISSTTQSPLDAEQQSEITNATSEIAAGTASAACLAAMQADAADMTANNSTCLGPGYGITPPPLPVEEQIIHGHNAEVMTNGNVYAVLVEAGATWGASSNNALSSAQSFNPQITAGGSENMLMAYDNGYIMSGAGYQSSLSYSCSIVASGWNVNPPGGSVTSGTVTYSGPAYGVCANAMPTNYSYNGTATNANPLGTGTAW